VVMAAQWKGPAAIEEQGISASTVLPQWKLLNTIGECCVITPALPRQPKTLLPHVRMEPPSASARVAPWHTATCRTVYPANPGTGVGVSRLSPRVVPPHKDTSPDRETAAT
jgi:hypothetical protein